MDYRARFYSHALGRFIQPDSLIPNPGNPQTFNRFAYVLNSPLNYTDPTGHYCADEDENGNPVRVDCDTGEIDDGDDSGSDGGDEPTIPEWDPDFHVSKKDKEWAEAAYLSLLESPEKFAEYYVNPSNAPEEYFALELFAQYSELHITAEQLIFLVIADIYGLDVAGELDVARLKNTVNSFAQRNDVGNNEFITASSILVPIIPALYDYRNPPAEGWVWRGDAKLGAWFNPQTNEYLRVDYTHHGEMHYDYRAKNGLEYRIFMDGRVKPK